MDYLCSECSTQLSDFEVRLNKEFPIGKLYCEFCQNVQERKLIKKLSESISDLSFYDNNSLKDFEEDLTRGFNYENN